MPDRQFGVPEALRCRVAHYRYRRSVRRGRGIRQAARIIRAADALGSWPGCNSTRRTSGDVRLDDEELSSWPRRAKWAHCSVSRIEKLHELRAKPGSEIWMGECGQHGA